MTEQIYLTEAQERERAKKAAKQVEWDKAVEEIRRLANSIKKTMRYGAFIDQVVKTSRVDRYTVQQAFEALREQGEVAWEFGELIHPKD